MGRSVTTKIVSTVAGRTGDVSLAITDVNGAAPLNSPTLTGIPKAPTAAAGTSTTQIATTEFVSNIAMGAGSVSITNAAPSAEAVGVSSALGSSSAAARSDHVHAMPGVATATAAGFMSAADKVRLDATAPLNSPTFTGTASFEYIENKPEFLAYGEDGGGLMFQLPTAGTTLTGDIIIDSTKDVVRIYESGGDQRGLSFDLDEYSPSAGTRFSKSDHTHTDATINASGLMSAVDKTKLNGIAASAAALGTSAGTSLATSAAVGSATTAAKSDHVHPLPTLATLGAAAVAHSHDLSNASVKYADSAGRAHPVREDGVNINFNWTSKTGQPQWVWGANDGQDEANYYVYNPSGFSVDTAHNLRPGANQGIVWDDDAFGGGGDTASILLESGGGEDLAMMFRLTNDATDVFRFWNASSGTDAPGVTHHNDGMTLNGHVILNAANYDNYAPSRLRRSDGGDPYYLQHKWSTTSSLWRLDGYKPDGAFHAGVEVARADSAKNVDSVPWTSVTGAPSTYAPSAHAHDYAASNHTHNYAAASHTHNKLYSRNLDANYTIEAEWDNGPGRGWRLNGYYQGNFHDGFGVKYADSVTDPGSSKSGAGYAKLPGSGLIIQWGRVAVGNPGTDYFDTSALFPIVFPNLAFHVHTTMESFAADAFDASVAVTGLTNSSFSFTVQEWDNVVQQIYVTFIAIGY